MSAPRLLAPPLLAVLLLGGALSGCNMITGQDTPETARISVAATELEGTLDVVLSDDWAELGTVEGVEVFSADTVAVSPPWEETVDLRESDRFLVRVLPPGDHIPTASLRVELDGREVFSREQVLDEGAIQYQVLLQ